MWRVSFPVLWLCWSAMVLAAPVEFRFRPSSPSPAGNPFARDVWAEVLTPRGDRLVLPAFFRGDGEWAVRARAAGPGDYRLGNATETLDGRSTPLAIEATSPAQVQVAETDALGAPIRIDPRAPQRFIAADGTPFYPLGVNLPWPDDAASPDDYYPPTFAAAAAAGLNWTRVWMAHWSGLNLDWRAVEHGPSPAPGELLLDVAGRWDRIVAAAEAQGIRLQMVLQHHGQYSSHVNSNWDINPWNAANGGFLATPVEFFTSERAREFTRRKYRYIVARWGYSPAIFAWELFNEVKWTDARFGDAAANRAVADWHAEMARYIRLLDTERHLVTTSDDALDHPLQATMDFLQPHYYGRHLLAGVRRFDLPEARLDRPIFYGEVGDDNLPGLAEPVQESGAVNLPLAWAGLMSPAHYPAQLWYAYRLMRTERFQELGALSGFVRASGLDRRPELTAFSPAVSGQPRLPYRVTPGAHWHRMPPPTIVVPFDGSEPAALAEIPNALVWADDPDPGHEPFPHRMTLVLDYPRDATAVLRMDDAHPDGASVRVTLDGAVVAEHVWPRVPDRERDPLRPRPMEWLLPMKPGRRTLVIENPHGPHWASFGALATGLDVPAVAAVGRRTSDLVVLWLYHRTGVFSPEAPAAATATVHLADLPAGTWRVTWWDVVKGAPRQTDEMEHAGGTLDLETPPIARHLAVWLERK